MELSDSHLLEVEELVLNLPECNSGCGGDCSCCEPLICQAIEQSYLDPNELS